MYDNFLFYPLCLTIVGILLWFVYGIVFYIVPELVEWYHDKEISRTKYLKLRDWITRMPSIFDGLSFESDEYVSNLEFGEFKKRVKDYSSGVMDLRRAILNLLGRA